MTVPPDKTGPEPVRLWAFHLFGASVAGVVLWSVSYPGVAFFTLMSAMLAALVTGLVWVLWTAKVAVMTGRAWLWFLILPTLAAVTYGLMAWGAPLRLRWAMSRPAFSAVVAGHPIPPPGRAWESFKVPDRIGAYTITSAAWVPGGAVFYEAHGAFFDDAGFAYLPAGPTAELEDGSFESPSFAPLGGGWYVWTASW